MTSRRRFLFRYLAAGAAFGALGPRLLGAPSSAATHRVRRGDTLSEIARDNGVTVGDLKRANHLRSDLIRVGQVLVIPGVTQEAALAAVVAATRKVRVDRNRWRYVVAHHSAIEKGNAAIYGAAHTRRGMEHGLAYHFVIGNGIDSGDGEIEIGPRWIKQLRGGHVRNSSVNNTGIGICIVGNLENHRMTPRQQQSFNSLLDFLQGGYVAPSCKFTVHKWVDRNHTLCPGKFFPYGEISQRA